MASMNNLYGPQVIVAEFCKFVGVSEIAEHLIDIAVVYGVLSTADDGCSIWMRTSKSGACGFQAIQHARFLL